MNRFQVRSENLIKLTNNPDPRINYRSSDIGRHFGMERIALHHVILDPNFRTSYPHAESFEEEFVLVLKGRPTVWIDGNLYSLEEGDCIGFAAGTGSAHSFLNNDSAPCELLVAGERTKVDNLCAFPVNPELKESHAFIWWDNPPKLTLGVESPWPQVGNCGSLLKSSRPANIKSWLYLREHLPFSYETCEVGETFSLGRDLTSALGLSALGMYVERLDPGKRTSWPHAHRYEDELLYVLEGDVDVWVNGGTFSAKPGDFVGFKAGTGDVHTVVNNSSSAAFLFVLGERNPAYKDQIFYSHHPKQNELNAKLGRFWAEGGKLENLGTPTRVPRRNLGTPTRVPRRDTSGCPQILSPNSPISPEALDLTPGPS